MTPLLVLLYDRTFATGTFRAAWARRRGRPGRTLQRCGNSSYGRIPVQKFHLFATTA